MSQPAARSSLVGSIVERKQSSPSTPPTPKANGNTGFPSVQHRSKSAFSRSRDNQKKSSSVGRPIHVPLVVPSAASVETDDVDEPSSGKAIAEATEDWRKQMEEENRRKVESMSAEEVEAEKKEILERFGPDIAEILKKARAAREAAQGGKEPVSRSRADSKVLKSVLISRPTSPVPLSTASTRPPSRTDRHLRFAEITPKDVHVYESAPPSPKRKPLALPSPMEADGPAISLGDFKGKGRLVYESQTQSLPEPMDIDPPEPMADALQNPSAVAEGTPEDIRRRFFPNAAPHDPSLAWIEGENNTLSPESSALRFNLSGMIIPPDVAAKLPTHLGLHHHSEGTHAGYTLEDIFLLSRSTVPAQRASMLDVLSRIARQISLTARKQGTALVELEGQEATLRQRMLAAGLEAMFERGTVGIRAIGLVWACTVDWDAELAGIEGIELKSSLEDPLAIIQLEHVLPQISDAFATDAHPPESLSQLLELLYCLAQYSNEHASTITTSPKLLARIIRRFVATPISSADGQYPQPLAIRLLSALTISSRENATAVAELADALLRFVVSLPSSSMYPEPLATSLLAATLRLFTHLAAYGLCAQLATTAAEQLHSLARYIASDECHSDALREAWFTLIEAWIVCSRDPHKTTPSHDILWSQVVGWGWGEDLFSFAPAALAQQVRIALWRAQAAWLEGANINSPKGGETEKASALSLLRPRLENGIEGSVIQVAVRDLDAQLSSFSPSDASRKEAWQDMSLRANLLSSAIRLWLSCLPPHSSEPPQTPPFMLPFAQISMVCARLVSHPLWSFLQSSTTPPFVSVHIRSLSLLLSTYLDFSRFLPGANDDLWLAQAFAILRRLTIGDELAATRVIQRVVHSVNPDFVSQRGWTVPSIIWEKQGLESILPFLEYSLEHAVVQVSPLWPTPGSIARCNTLRLPRKQATEKPQEAPLPFQSDWVCAPLDHLLRSGQSDVFKHLPSSWDFSETELVRATLFLAKVHREVLYQHSMLVFSLNREETVFSCMKVFMLEHGQQQETSVEEVFRDSVVGQLVDDLLRPFTLPHSQPRPSTSTTEGTLEDVATRFLAQSTPFYQYYTDFVGLYDSISFSHPLFARLLLPPLSMRYAVDYRKYLWADYGHVIRTIKTPLADVVGANLAEFLYPVETNSDVITAYIRALVKGNTQHFTHLVAVHHIACNIWPDLRSSADEKAVKLLQAIVSQGSLDVIRDVVQYHSSSDAPLLPPACFAPDEQLKVLRRTFVDKCGPAVKDRLELLLQ